MLLLTYIDIIHTYIHTYIHTNIHTYIHVERERAFSFFGTEMSIVYPISKQGKRGESLGRST
mgnify:FL=1